MDNIHIALFHTNFKQQYLIKFWNKPRTTSISQTVFLNLHKEIFGFMLVQEPTGNNTQNFLPSQMLACFALEAEHFIIYIL